jgi:hypothetical protein
MDINSINTANLMFSGPLAARKQDITAEISPKRVTAFAIE